IKLHLERCSRKQWAVYQIVAIDVGSRREERKLCKVSFYDLIIKQTYLNVLAILFFFENGCSSYRNYSEYIKKAEVFK
ncbi:hypothetical protein NMG60_11012732, partial [Bertholletia excelsa]